MSKSRHQHQNNHSNVVVSNIQSQSSPTRRTYMTISCLFHVGIIMIFLIEITAVTHAFLLTCFPVSHYHHHPIVSNILPASHLWMSSTSSSSSSNHHQKEQQHSPYSSSSSSSMSNFQKRMLERMQKEDARQRKESINHVAFLNNLDKNESSLSSSSSSSSVSSLMYSSKTINVPTSTSLTTIQIPPPDNHTSMNNNNNNNSDTSTAIIVPTTNRILGTPINFHIIKTLDQFKSIIMHKSYQDKMIVVRFFAPWCKACKAIAPSFHRLAILYPQIIFVDIPVLPENANLHQGFHIQTLPFGHVYYPQAGLVEEMIISKKKYFNTFVHTIQTYIQGYCLLPMDDDDDNDNNNEEYNNENRENHKDKKEK